LLLAWAGVVSEVPVCVRAQKGVSCSLWNGCDRSMLRSEHRSGLHASLCLSLRHAHMLGVISGYACASWWLSWSMERPLHVDGHLSMCLVDAVDV
jgi:hypothetical protein